MVEKGGHVVMIDVNTEDGGLSLNEDFFVDFGAEPNGPALPHGLYKIKISGFWKNFISQLRFTLFVTEMRYPGGDCTSDVWLPLSEWIEIMMFSNLWWFY